MILDAKTAIGACLAAALTAGAARASMDWERARAYSRRDAGERARAVAAGWPEAARLAAGRMLEAYGAPDDVGTDALSWRRKGPWERTTVRRAPPVGEGAEGALEQSVRREVPAELREDLRRFGRGVSYDPATGELSARSDGEERNFLALNLAVEVVSGLRTVADARAVYDRAVALSLEGKASPYMRGLLFAPEKGRGRLTRP